MKKKNIKVNKFRAIAAGVLGGVESLAKRVPIWGDVVEGLEKYQSSIKEQMRIEFLDDIDSRMKCLESGYKEILIEYFNTQEGNVLLIKLTESSFNAEYKDKQGIFINALVNAAKIDVSGDEKMRFVDLIRHLSKVALNVLYVIYKMYDKNLDDKTTTVQISIRKVVTKANEMFKYPPELTESAFRELKSIGLFSNITGWRKSPGTNIYSIGGSISADSVIYTTYSRHFIEFIRKEQ